MALQKVLAQHYVITWVSWSPRDSNKCKEYFTNSQNPYLVSKYVARGSMLSQPFPAPVQSGEAFK